MVKDIRNAWYLLSGLIDEQHFISRINQTLRSGVELSYVPVKALKSVCKELQYLGAYRNLSFL